MPAMQDSSTAVQDYLEQIHNLIEAKGYARAVEIAGNLGVSQASVSAMLRRLDAEGFVVHERYRGLVLTAKGRQLACEIIERHDILTRLLRRFGIDEETIYRDVEGSTSALRTARNAQHQRSVHHGISCIITRLLAGRA